MHLISEEWNMKFTRRPDGQDFDLEIVFPIFDDTVPCNKKQEPLKIVTGTAIVRPSKRMIFDLKLNTDLQLIHDIVTEEFRTICEDAPDIFRTREFTYVESTELDADPATL